MHEYGQYLTTSLPKFVQQFSVYKDELTLYVAPAGVVPVLTFLRDHTQSQFKAVMDITAVDFPTRPNRFEVSAGRARRALARRRETREDAGASDARHGTRAWKRRTGMQGKMMCGAQLAQSDPGIGIRLCLWRSGLRALLDWRSLSAVPTTPWRRARGERGRSAMAAPSLALSSLSPHPPPPQY
jgi:hypothetical protein